MQKKPHSVSMTDQAYAAAKRLAAQAGLSTSSYIEQLVRKAETEERKKK